MSSQTGNPPSRRPQLLFLYPLVYRPLEANFGGLFRLLSEWYCGHIFALSGRRQTNVSVGDFYFHSEQFEAGAIGRLLRGLHIQIVAPLKLLRRNCRVTAVIAYDPYRSGLAGLVLKYAFGAKLIVQINGDYHRLEPGSTRLKRVAMRSVFNLVLRRTDAVKVVNADQEEFIRRKFPRKLVYRFPNFVATEYFGALQTYQGDYLLAVGYPFDLKGMDVLIEAFKLVAKKHKGISLRIMGYCPPEELEKYKRLVGGHTRIAFVEPGWTGQVAEQMCGCYALVNAARSEAMGRVHIEAMACGKPIVATRTNGARECVENGRTGLLCAIGDISDLAEKLDELLSNPDRAAQMGLAGRMRMEEMFSERVSTEKFRAMLIEVA